MYITVKGMLRQLIQKIKAMLLCIEYGILFVDTVDIKIKACSALNAMFVETVDTLVFVALTQHLIQSTMRCENCKKWPLTPAKKEGYLYLKSLPSWGFSCSPVSLRRQLF